MGLTDVRATNPYDLDLSRRKLVALAGVLAMDPAVLVLDEPTTGQDAAGIERVGAVVRAYRDAGRSVVAITHDMEFAATNFTRVVVMRLGEIVADGPPAVIFAPDHRDLLASTGLLPPPAARIARRDGPHDRAGRRRGAAGRAQGGRVLRPCARAVSGPGLSGPDDTRPNHRRWPGSGLSSRPCRGHIGATRLTQAALRRS